MNNVFYNDFEGFYEFDADLTLDNIAPELLLAVYTGVYAA